MVYGTLKGGDFSLVGSNDADYVGYKVDRKRSLGTHQFLGQTLVSWHFKKQKSVAFSTTKVEYVVVGACYASLLWIIQ